MSCSFFNSSKLIKTTRYLELCDEICVYGNRHIIVMLLGGTLRIVMYLFLVRVHEFNAIQLEEIVEPLQILDIYEILSM